jgi:hypothetical protein
VDGNVGMLGAGYAGYFRHGDARELADLLMRCRDEIVNEGKPAGKLMLRLQSQCNTRIKLFEPSAEEQALRRMVDELV